MKRVNLMIILATMLAIFSGYAFADTTRELVQNDRLYALYDLSAIPLDLRAYGNIYFVSSIGANTSDVADGRHGNSWEYPFATIDYAVGKCVAPSAANKSTGDLILVSPNHVEDPATGITIDVDVAGVTIWCLGGENDRARIDYSFANNSVDIGANNVRIHGLTLRSSVTDVLIGIDVESGVTGTILEDIGFLAGEDGAGVDEFIVQIDLKATNTNTIIRRCDFREHVSSAGQTTGIMMTAAMTNVTIEDCVATGNYSTAFIDDGGIITDLHILRNIMKVKDGEPGIELAATTTGIIAGNMIESTGITPSAAIVAADCSWFSNFVVVGDGLKAVEIGASDIQTDVTAILLDTGTTIPATITTAQADLNILTGATGANLLTATQASIDAIELDTGTTIPATITTAQADLDILTGATGANLLTATQASIDAILVDTGTTIPGTITTMQGNVTDILTDTGTTLPATLAISAAAAQPSYSHPNYFAVTADMTSATWNTAAAHEIATVTGACRLQIMVETTATIVTTGTNGTMALGYAGNTSAIFSATVLDAALTGDVWTAVYGSAATTVVGGADAKSALTSALFDVVVVGGVDVGYTIATNAATTGTLTFHVWWTPLDATGAVAAGAGGVL